MEPYNLIHAPWLPVIRRSGTLEHIPPCRVTDRIEDDPYVAFGWPRPDFNGAAQEFLIGLLSTAAAPEDEDEWAAWWEQPPAPDQIEERLTSSAHAFNLDGPGPRFLQDLDPLDGAKKENVAALLMEMPGAQTLRNNADLFVKRGGMPRLCRAAAAMALFTLSCYAPAGGAGHRTSLRGGGPMTTLVVARHRVFADTLWGRLWPNVETAEQMRGRVAGGQEADSVFPWLSATRTSNTKAGGGVTTPANIDPRQVYWGMPRRIRLNFEAAENRPCAMTDIRDSVIVSSYRTKNYGTNYSEGFEHPLTPYYRNKPGSGKLPVHPNPGGITYRQWPGLVFWSGDKLREPAQTIRQWWSERARGTDDTRIAAFGYDMDNMKARAWVESEMPLWQIEDASTHDLCEQFVQLAAAGAGTVAGLLTTAVKSSRYDRPKDAKGDYGFVAERFFRDTESGFFRSLEDALGLIRSDLDADDPALGARERWAPKMARAALRLFDEYSPDEGLEDRDMHRHVKARFLLSLALAGRGKVGNRLFERDLKIASPETARKRAKTPEAA